MKTTHSFTLCPIQLQTLCAAAGDLEIVGVSGSDQAVIRGKACVSKEAWLEESEVNTISGRHAEINVKLPKVSGGWSWSGSSYAWLDLYIEVPQEIYAFRMSGTTLL